MRRTPLAVLAVLAVWAFLGAAPALAQEAEILHHEGLILEQDGLPMDGPVSLLFTIYDRQGNERWSEAHEVLLVGGYYRAILGEEESLEGVFTDPVTLLGISVDGAPELEPRHRMGSVPYAFVARSADVAGNAVGDLTPSSITLGGVLDMRNNPIRRIRGLEVENPGDTTDGIVWHGTGAIESAIYVAAHKDGRDADDGPMWFNSDEGFVWAADYSSNDFDYQARLTAQGTLHVPGGIVVGSENAASSVTVHGGLRIGPDEGDCEAERVGTLRWADNALQVCQPGSEEDTFTWTALVTGSCDCTGGGGGGGGGDGGGDGGGGGGVGEGGDGTSADDAGRSCRAIYDDGHSRGSGAYWLNPISDHPELAYQAYCDMGVDAGWTLVMKLSAGDLCYGSSHWTSGEPLNADRMLDRSFPASGEYDAKSQAFDNLVDTDQLRFQTTRGTVTVDFSDTQTPQNLMTTRDVPFLGYPAYERWRAAFGHDRAQAPIFMRGGQPETEGNICRMNPGATPSGCGKRCVFCYQAADGACCGCNVTANDVNSGVGNNRDYCGGGRTNCSTAGSWSNASLRTLVWARKAPVDRDAGLGSQSNPASSCSHLRDEDVWASGIYWLDPNGGDPEDAFRAYCDQITDGGGWTLVLKLSGNAFCYGSDNWRSVAPYNEFLTLGPELPGARQYDAKSRAFYTLSGTSELRFYSSRGASTSVLFKAAASPMRLMTTNDVPFLDYPDRGQWRAVFGHDRNRAPIFMRAGEPVVEGNVCRSNPQATPSGCGKQCMFCYQAADGDCCGCDVGANDVNSGVGNHPSYCGGGDPADCSTAGDWSDGSLRTLVWARATEIPPPGLGEESDNPGLSCKDLLDNDVQESGVYWIDPDGGDHGDAFRAYCDMDNDGGGWTLVLKLSAGDFCYGSSNWTSRRPFREANSLFPVLPGARSYDAKNRAFYELADVDRLRFQTSRNANVSVSFVEETSPMRLMTTNDVAFAEYPNRNAWRTAFGHDRNRAPIFMRAGVPVTDGNTCRNNPNATPSGCGKRCVFCYQAADGNCCGCDVGANDVNSGVGNHRDYCGGGDAGDCSTAGNWSDASLRTNVWAR